MICLSIQDSAKTECVADLILKHTVDYESDLKRVDVSFLAKDKGALTLQRNFEFSITNENDPPIVSIDKSHLY